MDGSLQPWSEHDEEFASQFVAHGLRVLPLIWVRTLSGCRYHVGHSPSKTYRLQNMAQADCAAHPRPIEAFRRIMADPTKFVQDAIDRAHMHRWAGYVLDVSTQNRN